jgi:transcriptional regulator with XRE-family HTH domain
MRNSFSERLNLLSDTVHPPGRAPHTSAEVIAALHREGINMSAPYLSQLRSGKRTRPCPAKIAALAGFFRIEAAYSTDDAYCAELTQELLALARIRDEGVRRVASRARGLSSTAQQDLLAHAEELHRHHTGQRRHRR